MLLPPLPGIRGPVVDAAALAPLWHQRFGCKLFQVQTLMLSPKVLKLQNSYLQANPKNQKTRTKHEPLTLRHKLRKLNVECQRLDPQTPKLLYDNEAQAVRKGMGSTLVWLFCRRSPLSCSFTLISFSCIAYNRHMMPVKPP